MADEAELLLDVPRPGSTEGSIWIPSKSNDFVVRFPVDNGKADSKWLQTLVDCLLVPTPGNFHKRLPNVYEDDALIGIAGALPPKTFKSRALLSSAAKQRQVVGSIRFSGSDRLPEHTVPPPIRWDATFRINVERELNSKGELKQTPRNASKYLFAPDVVSDVVLQQIGIIGSNDRNYELGFSRWNPKRVPPKTSSLDLPDFDAHPTGLIVIAGGTGTGKSTYARGMILRYLLRLGMMKMETLRTANKPLSQYSPPHLVSFEDPIEAWTLHLSKTAKSDSASSVDLLSSTESDLNCGIRLTCRAKSFDVDNLKNACLHALRQKPDVVYIGECREAKDWNLALELGGTGHVVVTTCHSSSLVDTFVKLAGPGSRDAQSRQNLASSLRGVLHLKSATFAPDETQFLRSSKQKYLSSQFDNFSNDQTYFSLWKNTPESVSNFVVDGLASLVIDEENVISRSALSGQILDRQQLDPGENVETKELGISKSEYFASLKEMAAEMAFRIDLGLT